MSGRQERVETRQSREENMFLIGSGVRLVTVRRTANKSNKNGNVSMGLVVFRQHL